MWRYKVWETGRKEFIRLAWGICRDCGWSMSVAGRWINCRCDIALLLSELRPVWFLYHSVLSVGFPVFSDGLRIRPIPAWLIPAIVKRSKDAYLGFSITQRNTFLFPHIIYILCRFHLYIEPFLFIYWIFLIYILSLFHLYIKPFSFIYWVFFIYMPNRFRHVIPSDRYPADSGH